MPECTGFLLCIVHPPLGHFIHVALFDGGHDLWRTEHKQPKTTHTECQRSSATEHDGEIQVSVLRSRVRSKLLLCSCVGKPVETGIIIAWMKDWPASCQPTNGNIHDVFRNTCEYCSRKALLIQGDLELYTPVLISKTIILPGQMVPKGTNT